MTAIEFDHAATGYHPDHAYWLAKAAQLAYSEVDAVRDTTTRWGFDRFENFHAKLGRSLPIEGTQAFAGGTDQMLVVAFRGTEPQKLQDWLTDANALATRGPGGRGLVHLGFNQALDAVYPQVRDTVLRFRDNDQTVWFTGHSLGGALAMLAAARLFFEEPNLLADGVYTFGQPRTCDPTLASSYDDAFATRTFRVVNNNDIVPQLPPQPVYQHVNDIRYFDTDGTLHERHTSAAGGLTDKIGGFTSDAWTPTNDGIRDHLMDAYVGLLEQSVN